MNISTKSYFYRSSERATISACEIVLSPINLLAAVSRLEYAHFNPGGNTLIFHNGAFVIQAAFARERTMCRLS